MPTGTFEQDSNFGILTMKPLADDITCSESVFQTIAVRFLSAFFQLLSAASDLLFFLYVITMAACFALFAHFVRSWRFLHHCEFPIQLKRIHVMPLRCRYKLNWFSTLLQFELTDPVSVCEFHIAGTSLAPILFFVCTVLIWPFSFFFGYFLYSCVYYKIKSCIWNSTHY